MPLPQHTSTQQLAKDLGQFFIKKIEDIRSELNEPTNIPIPQSSSCNGNHLTKFKELTHADIRKLVMSLKQQAVVWILYLPAFSKNIFPSYYL